MSLVAIICNNYVLKYSTERDLQNELKSHIQPKDCGIFNANLDRLIRASRHSLYTGILTILVLSLVSKLIHTSRSVASVVVWR